jgi:hypothetical protein
MRCQRSELIRQSRGPVYPYRGEDYGISLETRELYSIIKRIGSTNGSFRFDKLQRYVLNGREIPMIREKEAVHIIINAPNFNGPLCQIADCDFVLIEVINQNQNMPKIEVYGKIHTLINMGADLSFDNVSEYITENVSGTVYNDMPNLPDRLNKDTVNEYIDIIKNSPTARDIVSECLSDITKIIDNFLRVGSQIRKIEENILLSASKEIKDEFYNFLKNAEEIANNEIFPYLDTLLKISRNNDPIISSYAEVTRQSLIESIEKIGKIVNKDLTDKYSRFSGENDFGETSTLFKRLDDFEGENFSLEPEPVLPSYVENFEKLTIIKNLYSGFFSNQWHTSRILNYDDI